MNFCRKHIFILHFVIILRSKFTKRVFQKKIIFKVRVLNKKSSAKTRHVEKIDSLDIAIKISKKNQESKLTETFVRV